MNVVDRGVEGAKWGFGFGVAYSLLAVVLLLLGGNDAFARNGVTFEKAVVLYIAGGTFAGSIVGVFRPIARRRIGAAVVGFLVGFPLGMMVAATSSFRRDETTLSNVVFAVVFACMIGIPGGLILREVFEKDAGA